MTNNRETNLKQLRSVESTKKWNDCRENVRLLLQHMTEVGIVRMLLRQIERFLTDVHKSYPDDKDISAEISELGDVTSLKSLLASASSINAIFEKHSSEPGINNFRNALKRLMRLESIETLSVDYYDTMVDVLSGILMAILDHQWGRNNLDLWQRSFWQKTREDALIRVKHFWPSPETVELNRELWSTVADDIEVGNV